MSTDNPRHIKIHDYDYPLPEARIAKYPLPRRDQSKLLIYNKGKIDEDIFRNLADHLPHNSLMVFNNTKVIQARIHFRKSTGARIEIFLMEPCVPADYERAFTATRHCTWYCMIGNAKKWKDEPLRRTFTIRGQTLTLTATLGHTPPPTAEGGTRYPVSFLWDSERITLADILETIGELPIPPYLRRETQPSDLTTYQTVYSRVKGSVAAPTAGLHFTPEVLATLDAAGIQRDELTLHVGAGTFKPVKSVQIEGHSMHTEYIAVHRHTLQRLLEHDCDATAVGTTSVRTLESLYYMGVKLERNHDLPLTALNVSQWEPYDTEHDHRGWAIVSGTPVAPQRAISNLIDRLDRDHITVLHSGTQVIIAPGYHYKFVRRLITNFHQPQSTLLLLVSALIGNNWRSIYDYALTHDFRFLSYGDSSLLIP